VNIVQRPPGSHRLKMAAARGRVIIAAVLWALVARRHRGPHQLQCLRRAPPSQQPRPAKIEVMPLSPVPMPLLTTPKEECGLLGDREEGRLCIKYPERQAALLHSLVLGAGVPKAVMGSWYDPPKLPLHHDRRVASDRLRDASGTVRALLLQLTAACQYRQDRKSVA